MATLTPLDETNGYYIGVNSISVTGYLGIIPGFQKIYFCDGRTYDKHGFSKLDFINTKITSSLSTPPTGAFQVGEVMVQTSTGATGIYGECTDIKLTGTPSGTFTKGELVIQATTGAKGYVAYSDTGAIYVYPITYTNLTPAIFAITDVVTGQTSSKTIAPSAVSDWFDNDNSLCSIGLYHFIYRTTTIQFDNTNIITGQTTGKVLTPSAVDSPPHFLPWIPVAGMFPDGGSNIGCLCFGRIFLNSMLNPHQWSCSRIFNTLDWDTGQTDVGAATISQNAKAGEVGDPLVAEIPYKDSYLIWGCANEMWILRSDPLQGGVNTCISKATGIFSPTSYCWDDKNNLYFLGTDGIYSLSSEAIYNAQPPENITKQRIPKLITSLKLNRRTDRVVMGYDKQRYGVQVAITQQDGQWTVNFWIDLRTGGIFPDVFPSGQTQSSIFYFNSFKSEERGLLLGGYDGFIRKYDESTKSDEGSNAINSSVVLGPINSNSNDTRAKLAINEVSLTLGQDSDNIQVDIYSAKSADELVNNVLDNVTPAVTKSFTGDNLKNSVIDKVTGISTAIKLSNTTLDQSWSIEETNIILSNEGRKK